MFAVAVWSIYPARAWFAVWQYPAVQAVSLWQRLQLLMGGGDVEANPGPLEAAVLYSGASSNAVRTATSLLLLQGSGRSHEHPVKEPNVAHGVVAA
jgi:hypothetical protein